MLYLIPCQHCGEQIERERNLPLVTCFKCKTSRQAKRSKGVYVKRGNKVTRKKKNEVTVFLPKKKEVKYYYKNEAYYE